MPNDTLESRRLYFLYCFDPSTEHTTYRFGGAEELMPLCYEEMDYSFFMRKEPDSSSSTPMWRGYIQVKYGSLMATKILIAANSESEALSLYYRQDLAVCLAGRKRGVAGKEFFICEGIRGLIWMLDEDRRSELFESYFQSKPEGFFTTEAMIEWMCSGYVSKADYMAMLQDMAAQHPDIISLDIRVQLALQIIQSATDLGGSYYATKPQ